MAAQLPAQQQLALSRATAQWRQWHSSVPLNSEPVYERRLGGGKSNTSILLRDNGHRFVLRLDGPVAEYCGLNRNAEWRALHSAHRAALAPAPVYFNPDLKVMVTEYLAPQNTLDDRMQSPQQVAALLAQIHQLPAIRRRLNLGRRIRSYEQQLARQGKQRIAIAPSLREKLLAILATLEDVNEHKVLCHGDLLRANRLYSGQQLWALDWEYSAMASPWFDLAVVAIGDELTAFECEALIDNYLGASASNPQRLQFWRYSCVYRYLEILWYALGDEELTKDNRWRVLQLQHALADQPV